ncbi:MAG: PDZ domain-containing protein [Myxococcales bacterium]|nr:PDZ domain-containing protein [Myxococcales bacterium]
MTKRSSTSQVWKPLLALMAVLAAFTITFVWKKPNGLGLDIDGSSRAQAARSQDPYDLTQLSVLNRAILEVTEHYVEPARIDHRRMLLGGLNAIQRTVAPVMVRYEEGSPTLAAQVNDQRREFAVDVSSPWALSQRFREVFDFLQRNLDDEDVNLRDIEYAAVNGMLRTLDPHTVLLTPDIFEEMQMSTRGEFGGLGIVISIRDGHLTVIRPMPNTPAARAGLERGDRIVKINDESTLNMPLSEAVERLRGPPGSRVRVFVRRKNPRNDQWGNPQRFELVRAVIHIESVEHRSLGDGIGYVKINSFQGNTHEDLRRALADLHRQELRGLVLDMRDNPGGLLDQAVRIADTFLPSGAIVATSSNDPRQREEKFASAGGTEPSYPLIVLVNGSSASASEIVAGALKNHDRALVIGQRTFGKGSVQVLNNFQDGSALKLTVAQYLTPGDVSIQGVGIIPDIGIDPMTIDREDMDLDVDPEAYLREADLRSHLTSDRVRRDQQRPSVVLRYYLNREMRQRLREADPRDSENEEEDEFLTRFSKEILRNARRSGRREMLEDAAPVIERIAAAEMQRAVADLRTLGVDWSEGPDRGPSEVRVEVSTDREGNVGRAGEPFTLRVRVTNTGQAPLHRLRATTKSDFPLFDDRELVFGLLAPGQTREWTTTLGTCVTEEQRRVCRLPRDTPSRADGIRVEFGELHGHAPPNAEIRTTVQALPLPLFAYAVQVADDIEGNGDGRLQRGEKASLYLRVRNVGTGRTYQTHANLRNLSGRGIVLQDGRFRIDDIEPGQERLVRFTFEVLGDFERDEAKLQVSVIDADLRQAVTEDVVIPIASSSPAPTAQSGRVTLRQGAVLRAAPSAEAEDLGVVDGGGLALPAEANTAGFVRVRVGEHQVAWVSQGELGEGSGGQVRYSLNHMPPRIALDYGDSLVTRDANLRLRGTVTDTGGIVRDVYIFAGAQKVFFASTRGQSDRTRATFDTSIPLHGGINYITVFARESDDVVSRKLIVVRRDAADGSLMPTPRWDDEVFGSVPGTDGPAPE